MASMKPLLIQQAVYRFDIGTSSSNPYTTNELENRRNEKVHGHSSVSKSVAQTKSPPLTHGLTPSKGLKKLDNSSLDIRTHDSMMYAFAAAVLENYQYLKNYSIIHYSTSENLYQNYLFDITSRYGSINKEVGKIEQMGVDLDVLYITKSIMNFEYSIILKLLKKINVNKKDVDIESISKLEQAFNISKLRTKSRIRYYKLQDIQTDLMLLIRAITEEGHNKVHLQELKDKIISKLKSSVDLNKHLATLGLNEESIYDNFVEKESQEGRIDLVWKNH